MTKYSQQMVKGMLQLLSNCPAETAHLRKELLIAAKHILTTELRNRTSARPLRASERARAGPSRPGFLAPWAFPWFIAALAVFSLLGLCLPSSLPSFPLILVPLSDCLPVSPATRVLALACQQFLINVTISLAQFTV